jgi:hypothetical protein
MPAASHHAAVFCSPLARMLPLLIRGIGASISSALYAYHVCRCFALSAVCLLLLPCSHVLNSIAGSARQTISYSRARVCRLAASCVIKLLTLAIMHVRCIRGIGAWIFLLGVAYYLACLHRAVFSAIITVARMYSALTVSAVNHISRRGSRNASCPALSAVVLLPLLTCCCFIRGIGRVSSAMDNTYAAVSAGIIALR